MFHRIFPHPMTTNNETWASLREINFEILPAFKDPLIIEDCHDQNGIKIIDPSPVDLYKKVALDIVTETVFDYPYPRFSEKVYKPIAFRKMFIIIGPARSLEHLQSLGFETFEDFINEDYDKIQDPGERFNAVMDEIVRYCSIPLDIVQEQMLKYKDKLDHNKKLYDHYQKEETIRDQIRQQLCSN